MATVALIPSVLGLRPAFYDDADSLRDLGHDVRIVDMYDGGARDTYEQGQALRDEIGVETMFERAVERAADVPDGFVAMGFSMGAAAATHLATHRSVIGVVQIAAAVGPDDVDGTWPTDAPVQVHVTEGDEFATPDEVQAARGAVEAAGGTIEVFTYPGAGHLFMDKGLPAEYDRESADLLLRRVADFLERVD